jgi:hypothetical protein
MRIVLMFLILSMSAGLAAQPTARLVRDTAEAPRSQSGDWYCSPGVVNKSRGRGIDIGYMLRNGGMVRPDENLSGQRPGELDLFEAITIKLKAPLINKPSFKLLAGFSYEPEKYIFSSIPITNTFSAFSPSFSDVFHDLDTRVLKQSAISLYSIHSLNDRHYIGLRARAGYNGDYGGLISFDDRYASYMASAVFGFKRSARFEYGFGLNFSHDFRRTLVLPFIVYNRTFSPKWGIEAVFPAVVQGRHNLNRETILLFGYEYNSQSYAVDIQNSFNGEITHYHLGHSEFLLGASLERQIVPWVWLNLKAGYQINLHTRFDAVTPNAFTYRALPANAPYLRLGVFISPPESKMSSLGRTPR